MFVPHSGNILGGPINSRSTRYILRAWGCMCRLPVALSPSDRAHFRRRTHIGTSSRAPFALLAFGLFADVEVSGRTFKIG